MMKTYDWELSNSWECYTPDMTFLNCESCAEEFAKDQGLELRQGAHRFSDDRADGVGVSECWACGHEFDAPATCDGCGAYLKGNLTSEGRDYLLEDLTSWPLWLVDYYLGGEGVELYNRTSEAEAAQHKVILDGVLVGYHTHLSGLFVCIKCGHLCECGQDQEEE